jgi:hypothetical protein
VLRQANSRQFVATDRAEAALATATTLATPGRTCATSRSATLRCDNSGPLAALRRAAPERCVPWRQANSCCITPVRHPRPRQGAPPRLPEPRRDEASHSDEPTQGCSIRCDKPSLAYPVLCDFPCPVLSFRADATGLPRPTRPIATDRITPVHRDDPCHGRPGLPGATYLPIPHQGDKADQAEPLRSAATSPAYPDLCDKPYLPHPMRQPWPTRAHPSHCDDPSQPNPSPSEVP